MKVEADSINELIEKSGDQKETMAFLDDFIRKAAPGLSRKLFKEPSITMIGYGEIPWRGKTKSRVGPLISLAPQKGSTNMYVSAERDGQALPLYYSGKLGKVSAGKSCIRVKKIEKLDLAQLKNLINDAIDWMARNKIK